MIKIEIDVSPPKQNEFEHAVSEMLSSPQHPDQIKCEISKEMCRPNIFIYSEEWKDETLMQQHLQHGDFRSLMGAMKTLGRITDARIISSDVVRELPLTE